jgi:hypothetical protein
MQLFALFRLAFASAPALHLNLAAYGNSQDRSTKSTLSGLSVIKDDDHSPSTDCKHTVSGSFNSPSGVLFTFPSRYWFTIGRQVVFSLGRWSSRLPTGFHVSRGTLDTRLSPRLFAYRAFTFCGSTFHSIRLRRSFVTQHAWSATPVRSLRERSVKCKVKSVKLYTLQVTSWVKV